MKRVLVVLFALSGVWLAGCQKNSSELSPSSTTDFESVLTSAARLAVVSDSVTVHKCKGKLTEVATADLAASITDYITATYSGSTIKFSAKDESGRVVVAVTLADGTVKGLLFNADGTFKEELKRADHKARLTKVEVADIPSVISLYITTNYTGAVIKQAGKNADGEYFVEITVDGKFKVLLFKADLSFNKELERPAIRPGGPGKGAPGKHK